jgi:RHS repeat-associated protein
MAHLYVIGVSHCLDANKTELKQSPDRLLSFVASRFRQPDRASYTWVRSSIICFLLMAAATLVSFAQGDPNAGLQPNVSYVSGQYDIYDPTSGNVMLNIPVRNKVGKVPFSFNLVANARAYVVQPGVDNSWWVPGQVHQDGGLIGRLSIPLTTAVGSTKVNSNCNGVNNQITESNYYLVDQTGATHFFTSLITQYGPCNINGGGTALTADNTGYQLKVTAANPPTYELYDRAGHDLLHNGADPDGVALSISKTTLGSGNTLRTVTTYTDTLGQVALTSTVYFWRFSFNGSGYSGPDTYVYTDAAGNSRQLNVNYTLYEQRTNFGCAGINEEIPSSGYFPTSVTMPDGSSFGLSYEPTPGYPSSITGRIAKLTFPGGGYVSYAYTGGNSGVSCTTYKIPTLTRTVNDGKGHNSVWKYVTSSTVDQYQNFTVTETDPLLNTITHTFHGELETQRVVQDASLGVISTTVTCYFGMSSKSACITPLTYQQRVTVANPIGVYTSLGTASPSLVVTTIDGNTSTLVSYGDVINIKKYNTGAAYPPSGNPVEQTTITYANVNSVTCGSTSVHIVDHPCSITTTDSAGSILSKTTYTYNTGGHPTQTQRLVGGTTYLTSHATYNPNGTIATSTDVNGALTSYYYNGTNGCSNLLLTGKAPPTVAGIQLTTSQEWNCLGGVVTSSTDANGKKTSYNYVDATNHADPYWRIKVLTAPATDTTFSTTNFTYTPTSTETSMLFNGGASIQDQVTTTDGLGRPILVQQRQGPSSSNYDTVSYGYDLDGNQNFVSLPCSTTLGSGCTTGTTTTFDALNRPRHSQDAGTGTVDYTYTAAGSKFDVYVESGPSPNKNRRQMEYDGIGRLLSICEVNAGAGSGACAQQSAKTGFYTTYTYDTTVVNSVLYTRVTTVQNAQVAGSTQTRVHLHDLLGRLTSETNPETGTTKYVYDTIPSPCYQFTDNQSGNLTAKVDARGNSLCYHYDALNRLFEMGPVGPNPGDCKRFRFDSASNGVNGAAPTGITVANPKGNLVEAETDNCGAWPPTPITDEWFTYTPRGEVKELWESTPNSGGYYHPTTSYWENGNVENLWMAGIPSLAFGADGEGRVSNITPSSGQVPLTATTYNPASQVTNVAFGSADHDDFTYDSNTGRMKTYKFTVGANNENGTLTWSPNGTLKTLAIVDPWTSGNNQICNYTYDDLIRLTNADCGTKWSQTFTYDAFGNISKSGSSSFQAGYLPSTGAPNNRIQSLPGCTPIWNPSNNYDASGNLLHDCTNDYTWDSDGRVASIINSTPTNISFIYDALDRNVEQNRGGTNFQFVYGPSGDKFAIMKGQTLSQAFVPLPGGAVAEYLVWGLSHYRHPDWLGSDRLGASASHALVSGAAYAPFGEPYAQLSGSNGDLSFAGGNKDTLWLEYDFLYRQYEPKQSRWISPDPAGVSAADPTNPQSWNRYAYVLNNPLSLIDPTGLDCMSYGGSLVPGVNVDLPYSCDSEGFALGELQSAYNSLLEGENSTNWSMGASVTDIIRQVLGGNYSAFGIPTLNQVIEGAMIMDERPEQLPRCDKAGPGQPCYTGITNADTQLLGTFFKCMGTKMAGGATAPIVTHAVGYAATKSVEHGSSGIAGAYYHLVDGRFTAWGKYSKVMAPKLASNIALAAEAADVLGWMYFGYEAHRSAMECSETLFK